MSSQSIKNVASKFKKKMSTSFKFCFNVPKNITTYTTHTRVNDDECDDEYEY